MDDDAWSKDIAGIIADALVDGGVVDPAKVQRAMGIIAEEIWIRLLVNDYPPGAVDASKRITRGASGPNSASG